jgi:hypothetical protein
VLMIIIDNVFDSAYWYRLYPGKTWCREKAKATFTWIDSSDAMAFGSLQGKWRHNTSVHTTGQFGN